MAVTKLLGISNPNRPDGLVKSPVATILCKGVNVSTHYPPTNVLGLPGEIAHPQLHLSPARACGRFSVITVLLAVTIGGAGRCWDFLCGALLSVNRAAPRLLIKTVLAEVIIAPVHLSADNLAAGGIIKLLLQ